MGSTISVPSEDIRKILGERRCASLKLIPHQSLDAITGILSGSVNVGIASRDVLRGTYRDRYDSIKSFREERFGWTEFFGVLEFDSPPVGLFSIQAADWSLIALTDEDIKSVIACLVGPPNSFEWLPGSTQT
ncbi:hypothetical protein [Streptomyces sp. C36]|uniref:hypothetical protein n=1 Tax=Streptomyces sp. C36 TaxID=3237122 RepID=UPI0034C6C4AF